MGFQRAILSEEDGERDLMHQLVMEHYYEKIVGAEKFARDMSEQIGHGLTCFLEASVPTPIIKVNEVENVSGYKFPYSTTYIGNAWRDAYMHRLIQTKDRKITSKHWNEWFASLIKMRDAFELDAPRISFVV